MNQQEYDPSDELTMLSHQVGALRRYLVHQRATLPAPGYHLDITPEDAEKTRNFLEELPGHCRSLQASLHDFQARTAPENFKDASAYLQKLANDPAQFFREPALEIFNSLRADKEQLASLGIEPPPIDDTELTLC